MINNLKQIRELYGVTQEQVSNAINVNRVTVANWEIGNSIASNTNQEKLSIYYGVGPEYFYQKELDEEARKLIIASSKKSRDILEKSQGKSVKENVFHEAFENMTFKDALNNYVLSMKMLLASADSGELDKLKTRKRRKKIHQRYLI